MKIDDMIKKDLDRYETEEYRVREIEETGDNISIRPIEDRDMEIVYKIIYSSRVDFTILDERKTGDIIAQELLIARCIRRINNIYRRVLGLDEWWGFILKLQIADKNRFLKVLRRLTYQEEGKEYDLYF